jgi:uncharacterized protein
MTENEKMNSLKSELIPLYEKHQKELLFHGWHHITFVTNKSVGFAKELGANEFLVHSAALVHDLNYITQSNSKPEAGKDLREEILTRSGYQSDEIAEIEKIIMEECTTNRHSDISMEAKALSDADTLFKALPVTPILFASKYIEENNVDIAKLAHKICEEQNHLMESGIYFYTDKARQTYLHWAKANLQLWGNVEECLKDEDVKEMLKIAQSSEVI